MRWTDSARTIAGHRASSIGNASLPSSLGRGSLRSLDIVVLRLNYGVWRRRLLQFPPVVRRQVLNRPAMNILRVRNFVRLGLFVTLLAHSHTSSALTIVRNDIGGIAPGNTAGAGSLVSLFNAAADRWEDSILDTHVVTISFGWAARSGGLQASHLTVGQGGAPNRETSGLILFDNDGSSAFFMDATPFDNSEFASFTSLSRDLGGGMMNTGLLFASATGFAADRFDLYSIALHEIGHALGLSAGNSSFIAGNIDLDIDVVGPLPFAGSIIPTVSGAHLDLSTSLMSPSLSVGLRKGISAVDLLANAQISRFTSLNFSVPDNDNGHILVPDDGYTGFIFAVVLAGILTVRRKRGL
jgi:hypothetical protein